MKAIAVLRRRAAVADSVSGRIVPLVRKPQQKRLNMAPRYSEAQQEVSRDL